MSDRRRAGAVVVAVLLSSVQPLAALQSSGPVVRLKLITGTEFSGPLIDETDNVIVLDLDGFPCALHYDQVLPDSAYRAKRSVLEWRRGDRTHFTAGDFHALGVLALRHNRYQAARRDFAAAERLDASYRGPNDRAVAAFRTERRRGAAKSISDNVGGDDLPFESRKPKAESRKSKVESRKPKAESRKPKAENRKSKVESRNGVGDGDEAANRRARIIEGYKRVGDQLRDRVGRDLTLLETEHFLIWTDWARAEHADLRAWCERMYEALASRFNLTAGTNVFEGKCPVYCLRSRKRFQQVSAVLDDFDTTGAVGYTHSAPNGHVHVVVCRQGGSIAARDAFAATLIHEGTHAFLHRYRGGARLPHWINEGLANYIAQSVLGERCSYEEAADVVRRWIAQRNLSIQVVFSDDGTLQAHHYPVAHGLVAYLIGRDSAAFVGFIDDVKGGAAADAALERRFGLTTSRLEKAWRRGFRR